MVIIIMILPINVTVLLLRKKYNNNQNPFHVIPIINLLHWKVSRKSKITSKNFQISYEVGANCLLEFIAEFVQFGGELVPIKKQLTAFSNCGLQSLNCGVQVKKYMFIIESLIVKTDRTLIYSAGKLCISVFCWKKHIQFFFSFWPIFVIHCEKFNPLYF